MSAKKSKPRLPRNPSRAFTPKEMNAMSARPPAPTITSLRENILDNPAYWLGVLVGKVNTVPIAYGQEILDADKENLIRRAKAAAFDSMRQTVIMMGHHFTISANRRQGG